MEAAVGANPDSTSELKSPQTVLSTTLDSPGSRTDDSVIHQTSLSPESENDHVTKIDETIYVTVLPVTPQKVVMVGDEMDRKDYSLSPEDTAVDTSNLSEETTNIANPCLVCGDKGSGFHYSVYSCEGCKGFFKRTVQKNLTYTCKEDKNCTINRLTRNNCQFCRYVNCIEIGMKREAVREDRTPGGKQRGKLLCGGDVSDNFHISRDEFVMCAEDEEAVSELVLAQPDSIPELAEMNGDSSPRVEDINELMQYGYEELRLIILWAKRVPGFKDLYMADQMALLKSAFMELNILRLSYRSLDCPGRVRFARTISMSAEESIGIGWGSDLILATLDFIHRLQDISIDHTEFCLVNALVLTYPDATGLKNRDEVIALQTKILGCLRKYISTTYIAEPRRFGKLLLRLPALRSVSAKAAEKFLTLTISGSIEMNELVREMMS